MWYTVTVVLSFFFLFFYDLFQVRGGRVYTLLFSIIGYGGLCLSHFFLFTKYLPGVELDMVSIAAMSLGGLFLFLLFYSLFVEIPLKGTYGRGSGRRACTSGTYGFIRHPGFLWFALFQVCLMILFRRTEVYLFSLAAVLLDFLIVLVEDVWIFPRLFDDYAEYKKKVPFLIPGVFGGRNE
jgi:protein-S-isoprenylcysteine O-methyltransferase Ste14